MSRVIKEVIEVISLPYTQWKCISEINFSWQVSYHEHVTAGLHINILVLLAPWPSPRVLSIEYNHWHREKHWVCHYDIISHLSDVSWHCDNITVAMVTYNHGNIFSKPMPFLLEFHTLLGVLWALRRFFGCHGNGCQGNKNLNIFQPIWSKGPPSCKILWRSNCKHQRKHETIIRSVYMWWCTFS